MKKCEVISYFTLKKFNELENIVRADKNNNTKDGELFVGDTFDCTEEMYEYLNGNNQYKKSFVKAAEEETDNGLKDNNEENEEEDQDKKSKKNESCGKEKPKNKKNGKK